MTDRDPIAFDGRYAPETSVMRLAELVGRVARGVRENELEDVRESLRQLAAFAAAWLAVLDESPDLTAP